MISTYPKLSVVRSILNCPFTSPHSLINRCASCVCGGIFFDRYEVANKEGCEYVVLLEKNKQISMRRFLTDEIDSLRCDSSTGISNARWGVDRRLAVTRSCVLSSKRRSSIACCCTSDGSTPCRSEWLAESVPNDGKANARVEMVNA